MAINFIWPDDPRTIDPRKAKNITAAPGAANDLEAQRKDQEVQKAEMLKRLADALARRDAMNQ